MTARHFAIGGETTTFCLIPVSTLETSARVHPSKGRKEDCPACRAERSKRGKKKPSGTDVDTTAGATELNDVDLEAMLAVGDPPVDASADLEAARIAVTTFTVPVTVVETVKATLKKTKDGRWLPTADEVARVFELRAAGFSFNQIEAMMHWPEAHGNRPWRIIKGITKARG